MDFIENEYLKQLKSNIVKWYDFKDNSNILLIGNDIKEIEDELSTRLNQVIVKNDLERKNNAISKEKFDYVLIKDNLNELENIKKYLKVDGTVLLILNNRFGIANFAGADNFKSIYEENSNYFSKKQIENFLKNEGFSNYKFFYPLPNYEIANVIFSDEYLPKYNNTKLLYNNIYSKESTVVFDEVKALKQITKNGEFEFFANSYFIEINPKTKVKFASFNNIRKEEFRLCTKIYDDYVEKIKTSAKSQVHIERMKQNIVDLKNHGFDIIDKEENQKIISKYIDGKNFYQILLELINDEKIDETYELIVKWFDFIKSKFEKDILDNSDFSVVKNTYIDLVFENTFLINNNFVFFDQEWNFPNLPIEFILYRAINNMYIYNPEIEDKFPKEMVFKRFNLSDYIQFFEKNEIIIQENISNMEVSSVFEQSRNYQIVLTKINELERENKTLNDFVKEIDDIISKNNLLIIEEEKKEKYIEELTKQNGDLLAQKRLLEIEEKKKEEYISNLMTEIERKDVHIKNMDNIDKQKDEIINNLNEIIKVKDNQIKNFENMKLVKLTKKLRGMKN